MIEIYAVGGYNEVGKNCTAVNIDGEVVVIDLGIHLENYIKLTEDEDLVKIDAKKLMEAGACLLYTSPSPRDRQKSRMPSSA